MTLSSNFALKRGGGRNNERGITMREYGIYIIIMYNYTSEVVNNYVRLPYRILDSALLKLNVSSVGVIFLSLY